MKGIDEYMKRALILKDDTLSVVLKEGDILFTKMGYFINELNHMKTSYEIKYLNLVEENLIPISRIGEFLKQGIIRFEHLAKYATDIHKFI